MSGRFWDWIVVFSRLFAPPPALPRAATRHSRIYVLHDLEALRALLVRLRCRFEEQPLQLVLLADGVGWLLRVLLPVTHRIDSRDLAALLAEFAQIEPFEAQLESTFEQLEQGADDDLRGILAQCQMRVLFCGPLAAIEPLLATDLAQGQPQPPDQSEQPR
ncbi:hypothetical protein [Gloeobacter kilaueensis]|uniref:Uncharacterized protein n=1 Tax=Gloeobacter kilaueensis (strain ATCC BAA-2537 / CCAP 1431/1 / ULC 316 / JS1) TaxID=1183438 RepID=U5QHQ1_GLOK1|nr:hypothetical protein [Gloeobacter kilaueensis]AGY58502.1 hypothetical protein GKIL_2256 [Gloeobacter kilaueensis JS1]